jgi:2-oxoglutarate ferredoxin oxidoreductase subunit alpha
MKENRVLLKGNVALAEGAICAGCFFYFGYPITPQNDIPEYLSKELPKIGGVFIQAESEIASINMLMGASAAGVRAMTSSSGPGISLMQEGMSYMAGSEIPGLIVNVIRTGPGLGGIAATQGDYKQATRGGGHGDYRVIVLAPSSSQEMHDFPEIAFELSEKYRNPAMILADAILGQMKEPVVLKERGKFKIREKDWILTGAKNREPLLLKSLYLKEGEMEAHNWKLYNKYKKMEEEDVMYEERYLDDAKLIIVSFGSASRVVKTAISYAREKNLKVGLIRPITLFPFPKKVLNDVSKICKKFLVCEMNTGQMVDDVKLSVSKDAEVFLYAKPGGTFLIPEEIFEEIKKYV